MPDRVPEAITPGTQGRDEFELCPNPPRRTPVQGNSVPEAADRAHEMGPGLG